jgi:hypothetical protein
MKREVEAVAEGHLKGAKTYSLCHMDNTCEKVTCAIGNKWPVIQ